MSFAYEKPFLKFGNKSLFTNSSASSLLMSLFLVAEIEFRFRSVCCAELPDLCRFLDMRVECSSQCIVHPAGPAVFTPYLFAAARAEWPKERGFPPKAKLALNPW